MLTDRTVKAARPGAAPVKLWDEGGLHLHVSPAGTKAWRFRIRCGGRETTVSLGHWPEVSLADARDRRDQARVRIVAGGAADAGAAWSRASFEEVARAWHAAKRSTWSDVHAADVLTSLERLVFPAIGAMPIAAIDAPIVLDLLRVIEADGAIETARRVRQRISAVFRRAIAEKRATDNPAALVADALEPKPDARRHAALLDVDQARAAYAALGAADAPIAARLAAQLVALTAVRCASARGARWDEFELDGPAPVWRIPAARMKLKRSRKADAANDHAVPLAPAAVELLGRARAAAGGSGWTFPSRPGGDAPIGENAIGAVHQAAGLAGRHTPHGWRASFSTILNEARPADRQSIDLALAHAPKDKVEAAYNRAQQLGRRRELMAQWAELISGPVEAGQGVAATVGG